MYAYAGFDTRSVTSGVRATIAQAAPLAVRDGHVAGWVGVGGVGMGPRGTDEWLQIGLSAFPGDAASRVYYEVALPGRAPVYHEVRRTVPSGLAHRFAVVEIRNRPNWWRAWLNDAPVSPPVFLPGSHGRWTAQITGESWAGDSSGTCNVYSYAFRQVGLIDTRTRLWAPLSGISPFQDANYRLVSNPGSSFLAAAKAPQPTRLTAAVPEVAQVASP